MMKKTVYMSAAAQAREDAAWLAEHPAEVIEDMPVPPYVYIPSDEELEIVHEMSHSDEELHEEDTAWLAAHAEEYNAVQYAGKEKAATQEMADIPADSRTLSKAEKAAERANESKKLREAFGVIAGICDQQLWMYSMDAHAAGDACPCKPCEGCPVTGCPYGV